MLNFIVSNTKLIQKARDKGSVKAWQPFQHKKENGANSLSKLKILRKISVSLSANAYAYFMQSPFWISIVDSNV